MKIAVVCSPTIATQAREARARSYHVARVLAQRVPSAEVTLAHTEAGEFDGTPRGFEVRRWRARDFNAIVARYDIVISSQFPSRLAWGNGRNRLVFDCHAPFLVDWRSLADSVRAGARRDLIELKQRELFMTLTIADFTVCANERLRDLCVGMLQSLGVISTRAYDSDTSLRSLVDVAPFGIMPLSRSGPFPLRDVHPGVRPGDTVLAWTAPLTPPYDPEAVVRAVHRLAETRPNLKVLFLPTRSWGGAGAPLGDDAAQNAAERVAGLARELGLLDRRVFIPAGRSDTDIEACLAESDIGICVYRDCVDMRYAAGAHYLDLLAAGLPIVCTAGGPMSAMVESQRLGLTVPEGGDDGLVAAIERLADDADFRGECRSSAERLQASMSWENTLAPLIEFCREGRPPAVSRRERLMPMTTQTIRCATARARYWAHFNRP